MNKTFTIEELTVWIAGIKEAAKRDAEEQLFWFVPTMNSKFSIVAGWQQMFEENLSDIFCCSATDPSYVMCIKIAINDGPYAYVDFDTMLMPLDLETEEVDNTCVPLEWDDSAEDAAFFFMHEWERIMETYEESL
jgi:hypothetical protein